MIRPQPAKPHGRACLCHDCQTRPMLPRCRFTRDLFEGGAHGVAPGGAEKRRKPPEPPRDPSQRSLF